MEDMIPLGTGNSRFLKSVENFKALYPTYESFVSALVAGTLPVDFNGVNPDGISQMGTALNKLNLLKDSTAEMFGLNSSAVPDAVLAEVGKYKLHWWRRTSDTSVTKYRPVLKAISSYITLYEAEEYDVEFNYSKTVDCTATGASLMTPHTGDIYAIVASAPCYFEADGTLYYVPGWSTLYYEGWDGEYGPTDCPDDFLRTIESIDTDDDGELDLFEVLALYITKKTDVKKVDGTESYIESEDDPTVEYLQSIDRNTYPDIGTVNGWIYEYLGIPLENTVLGARIETGSYIGTGTYGSSNRNSLTFKFKPKLVVISRGGSNVALVLVNPGTEAYSGSSSYHNNVTWGDTDVSWYNANSAAFQGNAAETYDYIAIG